MPLHFYDALNLVYNPNPILVITEYFEHAVSSLGSHHEAVVGIGFNPHASLGKPLPAT